MDEWNEHVNLTYFEMESNYDALSWILLSVHSLLQLMNQFIEV